MVCRIQYVTNEGRVHRKTKGETMTDEVKRGELLQLTVEIVSAYVRNNALDVADLLKLIQSVYQALSKVDGTSEKLEPAVPIKESVKPDYIVCLEDGRKLKMLKLHLRASFGMTPAQYRERWGLPGNYPMVAPNYSKFRTELAKRIGLGTQPRGNVRLLRKA